MNRITSFAGAFVAATLLVGAPAAPAAGPADVTIRVEGLGGTIVPRAVVRTTTDQVVKDGAHGCPGTSAAGALELGSEGDWTGTWSDQFSTYSVDRVGPETHTFGSGNFWSFYVNETEAQTGICGHELSQGDEVLLAPQPEFGSGVPPRGLLRLEGVPRAVVAPGQSIALRVLRSVTEYPEPDFAPKLVTAPARDVTISGPGVTLTTDADGRASFVTSARGPLELRASKDGEIRSAGETLCVSDGADGACGSFVPETPTVCVTTGWDGLCGSPDKKAPRGLITSITEQQRFDRGKGPRELAGTSDSDPSGVRSVRLRLVRNDRGRCSRFDGDRLEFRRTKRCRITAGKWLTVGDAADWKYLLPERLPRGRYALDVEVTDKAGNIGRTWERGNNRVVFHVR